MNRLDKNTDGWAFVASQARKTTCDSAASQAPLAPREGFVERVLALVKQPVLGIGAKAEREQERLVAWAAGFALAASLLVSIWNWPTLEAVWADPGLPMEWPAYVEPLL
jgi:hypothetical protein